MCLSTMTERDMIAVQSMDGQLAIYEQEHFAFNRQLPNVLLPVRRIMCC